MIPSIILLHDSFLLQPLLKTITTTFVTTISCFLYTVGAIFEVTVCLLTGKRIRVDQLAIIEANICLIARISQTMRVANCGDCTFMQIDWDRFMKQIRPASLCCSCNFCKLCTCKLDQQLSKTETSKQPDCMLKGML